MCEPCQLFLRSSRLVVVAPHPDDELLMGGGLIQAALKRGMAILVVAVTEGEACFGFNDEGRDIASLRRAERGAGLMALGAGSASVHHLGIPDGKVADHVPTLRRTLEALFAPSDTVLTTWHLDGHPDHEATGACVARAAKAMGCQLIEAPVWMWHWAAPEHPAVPWKNLSLCPLSAALLERKVAALACHSSQLERRGANQPVVDEALQARAHWPFESFFVSHSSNAHE